MKFLSRVAVEGFVVTRLDLQVCRLRDVRDGHPGVLGQRRIPKYRWSMLLTPPVPEAQEHGLDPPVALHHDFHFSHG